MLLVKTLLMQPIKNNHRIKRQVKNVLLCPQNHWIYSCYPSFVIAKDSSGIYKELSKHHGIHASSWNPPKQRAKSWHTKTKQMHASFARTQHHLQREVIAPDKPLQAFLLTCRIRVHFYETYNCLWEVRRPANRRAISTYTTPSNRDWLRAWLSPAFRSCLLVIYGVMLLDGTRPTYRRIWLVRVFQTGCSITFTDWFAHFYAQIDPAQELPRGRQDPAHEEIWLVNSLTS